MYDTMSAAKPDDGRAMLSFRTKQSSIEWVRDEAKKRGVSSSELCREIFRRGAAELQREAAK